jgi:hypothetical protein
MSPSGWEGSTFQVHHRRDINPTTSKESLGAPGYVSCHPKNCVCLGIHTLAKQVMGGAGCPILLTIDNPATLDQESEAAPQVYGLWADDSGRDPLGWLTLHLTKNTTSHPCGGSTLTSCPASPLGSYYDRIKVTIVEIKDLRKTMLIEIGNGEIMPGWNGSNILYSP